MKLNILCATQLCQLFARNIKKYLNADFRNNYVAMTTMILSYMILKTAVIVNI